MPPTAASRKAPIRRGISRFIVMAMLQAARARRLGLPQNSAYSWGLNRAIFFAAAKRGFKGGESGAGGAAGEASAPSGRAPYQLGHDMAFRDTSRSELYFTIGDETQTEEDFARQITARFGDRSTFEKAWKEAEAIVAAADPSELDSGSGFYAHVYKPRRDDLAARWTGYLSGG
jgi:hypothetical protein